jgi:alpha-D-xyloside xylohydrolase
MEEVYMMTLKLQEGTLAVSAVREDILHIVYTKNDTLQQPSVLITEEGHREIPLEKSEESAQHLTICTGKVTAQFDKTTGIGCFTDTKTGHLYLQEAGKSLVEKEVVHYTTGGEEPVIDRVKTVDGERNFIRNLKPVVDRKAYRAKLSFHWKEEEAIHGLGQAEEGIYDYRHHSQYLYQHNMRIPMPFFLSTEGYGILLDCSSLMTFNDDENGSYLFLDTVEQLDYYFIAGDNFDQIIDGYRYLTGKAVMLPRWAFGYVQSKEAYHTGQELVDVVSYYRELDVPLDCIVQDWNTWSEDHWGEKKTDPERYPNLKETIDKIHDMNVHTMVSIWPNMNSCTEDYEELLAGGHMLNDLATYNAFSEEAREIYWKQAERGLFSKGFDSWWCDSTEPFSGPDWGGEEKREPWERFNLVGNEHKQYIDAAQANTFSLYHAKGIFDNQKKAAPEKRVVNLTRSGYASGQRYGTILWSGDIYASWKTLKRQLAEGLNFAMSGMPYWTLDIGAFFVVGSAWQKRGCGCNTDPSRKWFWTGEYNDGVDDLGYRELYVRWLEYGTFLPMFRSHGTDTPREIWNFGKKGEPFYDAIEKFIRLRYHLMPYIYSLAGSVHLENQTILRSLLFDFAADPNVKDISDEFMFGPSLLVCPVTEPMYYEKESTPLDREKTRSCYLPAGTDWFDYWTGERYAGGQNITAAAPIDQIPLFIKAGSILPTAEGLSYADQAAKAPLTLEVYPGADGSFVLYEDEGDNYHYEDGAYSRIVMAWDDTKKSLTIRKREGAFEGMQESRIFTVTCAGQSKEVQYNGQETVVTF